MSEAIFLGIDVGGSFIKYALVTQSGHIYPSQTMITPKDRESFLTTIDEMVQSCEVPIDGVGICCPGTVNPDTGMIYYGGAVSYLHELNLKEYVIERHNLPCAIINDGKAVVLAEKWLGNLQGVQNAITLTLGTGVGGGILLNNQLVQGEHFNAGELSFMMTQTDTESEPPYLVFALSAVGLIHKGALMVGLEDVTDGRTVFEHINKQDNMALNKLFQQYVYDVAKLIFNLQVMLDVQKIVIGGGISGQPILIEGVRQAFTQLREADEKIAAVVNEPVIEACAFREESNILGAVSQLIKKNK